MLLPNQQEPCRAEECARQCRPALPPRVNCTREEQPDERARGVVLPPLEAVELHIVRQRRQELLPRRRNEKKPRRGTLVMVRLLDESLITHIATILGTKLSVDPMRDDEIDVLSPQLIKGEKVIIPMSNSQVAGFALIDVINADDTKLVLSTVGDRKIFEQGQSSLIFL